MKKLCVHTGIALLIAALPMSGAVLTVSNTNDGGPGSFRDALIMVGAPGRDTIVFNIPGTGPFYIQPSVQFSVLNDTAGVLIDGFTQPGASPGTNPPSTATLLIVISGVNAGPSHGLWIVSPNNTVRGLCVTSFQQDGIRIEGTPHGTFNNLVDACFVGMEPNGVIPKGNGQNQNRPWGGVSIVVGPCEVPTYAYNNTVMRSLLSYNYAEGVTISSCPPGDVYGNVVKHNYIGTDVNGSLDFGNVHDGVYIGEGAHDNLVDSNLISGNDYEGVCIVGYIDPPIQWYTRSNTVSNNVIGLAVNRQTPIPNSRDGVSLGKYGPTWQLGYVTDNVIEDNLIAHNGRNGVMVWEHPYNTINADGNRISRNSIYDNQLAGIDLGDDGVNRNDVSDPDGGPNQVVNYPIVDTVELDTATRTTNVKGRLDVDTDPRSAVIEIFKVRPDPNGHGEGETFLQAVTPDAAGNWSLTLTGIVAGDTLTATATDLNNNTSEFALNEGVRIKTSTVGVAEGNRVEPLDFRLHQNVPNPVTHHTAIAFNLSKASYFTLRIHDASGRLVRTLAQGRYPASAYRVSWDGNDDNGVRVGAGLYHYTLQAEDVQLVKTLLIY